MNYTSKERELLTITEEVSSKSVSEGELKEFVASRSDDPNCLYKLMTEYVDIFSNIVASDDKSIEHFYSQAKEEMDTIDKNRSEFMDFAEKVLNNLNVCLETPDMTIEDKKEIWEKQMEILRIVQEKDTEMREKEMDILVKIDEKDKHKRELNWKTIATASIFVLLALGIGANALSGKTELPKKS